jgi:phosphopantothenoylcysteine decarboxylase/phosphopantothenate--cysteine ligase
MELGARVIFITGKSSFMPEGAEIINVTSAAEMAQKFKENFNRADIAIGAAAVGDFTPERKKGKLKRESGKTLSLELKPTEDIMAWAGKHKGKKTLVGYAAQSGTSLKEAKHKIISKNLDMIVYNDISKEGLGFDSDDNEIIIMDKKGRALFSGRDSKEKLSGIIMGLVFEKAGKI